MKLFLKLHVLPYIVFVFHRLLSWTWRVDSHFCPEIREDQRLGRTATYAHWHRDETVLVIQIRRMRAGILNSKSSDGQMMARVVRLYGAKTAKGSSSRDGVEALKGLVRLAKAGCNPTVAVDGPRGPYKKVKPGVFQVSRLCQAKIYPLVAVCDNAWHFPKSWDKAYLPKPFARVAIYWGTPLPAVKKEEDPKSEELAQKLEALFARTEAEAVNFFTASKRG